MHTTKDYVFIQTRLGFVESVKVFNNLSDAVSYAAKYINNTFKDTITSDLTNWKAGEVYSKDGITVGVYISK